MLRQSYSCAQYSQIFCTYSRGIPCDESGTVCRSGHRVARRRFFRSLRSASLTCILNGRISSLMVCSSETLLRRDRLPVGTRDAQPLHAEVESGPLDSQTFGSPFVARNDPAGLF